MLPKDSHSASPSASERPDCAVSVVVVIGDVPSTCLFLEVFMTIIEVHDSIKDENGVKYVPVDIYFTTVGIINVPDAEEILQIMEEIRAKPLRIA